MKIDQWKDYFAVKDRKLIFLSLSFFSLLSTSFFCKFLDWNETRSGFIFHDPILHLFDPIDFSYSIILLTQMTIFMAFLSIIKSPIHTTYMLMAAIISCIVRATSLYLLPLEPPSLIIPLADPIINYCFYNGHVYLRDLFFSGHTANILIFGLLIENKIHKRITIAIAAMVGIALVLQHVHFSIDVLAAPFAAIFSYKTSVMIVNKYILKEYLFDIRQREVLVGLGLKKNSLNLRK